MLSPNKFEEITADLAAGKTVDAGTVQELLDTIRDLDAQVVYHRNAVTMMGQVAALIVERAGLGVVTILNHKSKRKTKKAAEFAADAARQAVVAAALLLDGESEAAIDTGRRVLDGLYAEDQEGETE